MCVWWVGATWGVCMCILCTAEVTYFLEISNFTHQFNPVYSESTLQTESLHHTTTATYLTDNFCSSHSKLVTL